MTVEEFEDYLVNKLYSVYQSLTYNECYVQEFLEKSAHEITKVMEKVDR